MSNESIPATEQVTLQAVTYAHIANVLLKPPANYDGAAHAELVELLATEEPANAFSRRTVFLLLSRLLECNDKLKALEN